MCVASLLLLLARRYVMNSAPNRERPCSSSPHDHELPTVLRAVVAKVLSTVERVDVGALVEAPAAMPGVAVEETVGARGDTAATTHSQPSALRLVMLMSTRIADCRRLKWGPKTYDATGAVSACVDVVVVESRGRLTPL